MKNQKIFEIVNIIASTKINQSLDLETLKFQLFGAEYDPKRYFALIYRVKTPKLTILVNKSGKIIFSGAKSLKDIDIAHDLFLKKLNEIEYAPQKNEVVIHNLVILADFGTYLNLEKIYNSNIHNDVQYEPEVFPGIIFKNPLPKYSAVLFRSGKISIVGLKSYSDIPESLEILKNMIG